MSYELFSSLSNCTDVWYNTTWNNGTADFCNLRNGAMIACFVLAVLFFIVILWNSLFAAGAYKLPLRFTCVLLGFIAFLVVLAPFGVVTILIFIGLAVVWIAVEVGMAFKKEPSEQHENESILANTRIDL